ncbi:MAG: SH3 domain-containing protein [Victivallaceae bacterium]
MLKSLLLLTLFTATINITAENLPDSVKGKVNSAALNVRIKPDTKFSTVSKLKYGEEVSITSKNGEWFEILTPADSSVWVVASMVKDGKTTREVNLRNGPGINYQPYGTVPPDTPVKVLDSANPDWLKIAPLPQLKAWVSSKFVTADEEQLKRLLNKDNKMAENTDKQSKLENIADKTAAKKEPATLSFVPDSDKEVTLEGEIVALKPGAVYVTHALVKKNDKKAPTVICYLHSNTNSLGVWQDRNIRVNGTRKLVSGWKTPVVEVEKIIPKW